MRIGGFQKFSLIDYPGKMSAIVFTQGCNFACRYCHNSHLVFPEQFQEPIEESVVLDFLKSRQGKLQGVVVTGGEPTIQKGLLDFLRQLKAMQYAVKLDTNGSHPEVVAAAIDLGLVDFIAMDIKTSLSRYAQAIGVKPDIERIKTSINLIAQSGVRHQFRTTVVKTHCSELDLKNIQSLIGSAQNYLLQTFIPSATIIDKSLLQHKQYTPEDMRHFRMQFQRGI